MPYDYYRFVNEISVHSFRDIGWHSYHVDREIATYKGQLPDQGSYTEFKNTDWLPGQEVTRHIEPCSYLRLNLSLLSTAEGIPSAQQWFCCGIQLRWQDSLL